VQLKKDFRLGCASAATQVEGGKIDHSWAEWAKIKGHIADETTPERADDHYVRWRQDALLMKDLGLEICRMGIEWARIEPEEGVYDGEAIRHYVDEVKLLISYGIKPLVTLHHFTNPMWFERKGAFTKTENIPNFVCFVEKMVKAFGNLADEYITINEPNVYATNGYFFGSWPPGEKSFFKITKVMSVMVLAHIRAYEKIHALQPNAKVSFANHVRVFAPENPKKISHRIYAKLTERFFQGALTKAMCLGEFSFPIRNLGHSKKGKYCDYIAINYYTRSTVSGLKDGVRKAAPINDLGWEIYPNGLVECARQLYDLCPMPIYITENGTCDNKDAFRSRYIYEHLKAITESDLPIERYYHWCFTDNFEWAEGESARFGIVHVNYETQERTVKKSGYFFKKLIAAHGVDEAMFEEYIANERYTEGK
jgi:Beta-glucosidase/6-phospho-beta-glucosidase/beta-galactosidase